MAKKEEDQAEGVVTIARGVLGNRNPQTGGASGVLGAFEDLGHNRFPLATTVRIHNAKKAVADAIKEREELRVAIVEPYKPDGREIQPSDEGYAELVEKINELFQEEVEIEIGPSVSLNGASANVELRPESFAVLEEIGFLKIAGAGNGAEG